MTAPASLRNSGWKDHTNTLVLTAVGPDRIGLVEQIPEFLAKHQCNIKDSKMAVFCGFRHPYSQVVDTSQGVQRPRWCVGGKMNIVNNCVEKWVAHPVYGELLVYRTIPGVSRSC